MSRRLREACTKELIVLQSFNGQLPYVYNSTSSVIVRSRAITPRYATYSPVIVQRPSPYLGW
jgi:hypothetical protein